jgi:hypothetical protein
MQRPTGVTVLAILSFLGAGCLVILGLLMFAGGAMLATALRSSMPGGLLAGVTSVIAVFCLLFAALYVATGIGLWTLKPWGRVLTIILVLLSLLFSVLRLLGSMMHFAIPLVIWNIIVCSVDVLILWYMFTPEVKRAFGEAMVGGPAATPAV